MNNLNFKKRTYNEIFLSLLIDAYQEGLLSTDTNFIEYVQNQEDIENILIIDYSIIAYQLSLFYDDAELIYNAKDIDKATSTDLDNIGKEKGITRPPATYPETVITFYIKTPTDKDIIIPKGTRIGNYKTDGPIYVTLENVTLPSISTKTILISGQEYRYTQVNSRSLTAGLDGRVDQEELSEIIDNIDNKYNVNIYAINLKGSSGGRTAYDDEEYRSLLKEWVYSFQKGNLACYTNYLERVDGLDSYYLIPQWNYPGTVKVVLDPNTIELIKRVKNEIDNNVGLCKEAVTVVGATEKEITVSCTVNVDIDRIVEYSSAEKTEIGERIKKGLYNYIMGDSDLGYNGLGIGEDFIPYQAGSYLNLIIDEIKDITFTSPLTPIEIKEDEMAITNLENLTVTVQ
jgi:uncharacterized phage protein gp47/JayE